LEAQDRDSGGESLMAGVTTAVLSDHDIDRLLDWYDQLEDDGLDSEFDRRLAIKLEGYKRAMECTACASPTKGA